MIRMTPPIRVISVVLACWGAARFANHYYDPAQPISPEIRATAIAGNPSGAEPGGGLVRLAPLPTAGPSIRSAAATSASPAREAAQLPGGEMGDSRSAENASAALPVAGLSRPRSGHRPRWRTSAWIFWRPNDGASGLAGHGQLGGSQLGFRGSMLLVENRQFSVSASVRAYRSRRTNDASVAPGLIARLDSARRTGMPIELILERRVAIEAGARGGWAIGLAGGTYAEDLIPGYDLDSYFQAGIVGLERRALYGDASIGVNRRLKLGRNWSLSIGGSAWASAQANLSRLDAGPQVSVALPVHRGNGRLALSWRQRIAGNARPGAGPALTFGIDY